MKLSILAVWKWWSWNCWITNGARITVEADMILETVLYCCRGRWIR